MPAPAAIGEVDRSALIHVRLDAALRRRAIEVARIEDRTLSSIVRVSLHEHVERLTNGGRGATA